MTAALLPSPVAPESLPVSRGAHCEQDAACVMEWAAFVGGRPWSDHPACVSGVIGTFLRGWNDGLSDAERTGQMARYVTCQRCGLVHTAEQSDHAPDVPILRTAGTPEQEQRRAWMCTDWLVRVQAPAWLALAGLHGHAEALRALDEVTAETVSRARPVIVAAGAAAGAAAGEAAREAAGEAAWAAAREAAGAAAEAAALDAALDAALAAALDAALAGAGEAAWAAAWDAAGAAAWDAPRPTVTEPAHELVARMVAV